MRNLLLVVLLFISSYSFSQELNCSIVVNANQTGNENFPIFKTLEKQLNELVNNTKWTGNTIGSQERIDCSMVISITDYSGDAFQASLEIQSSRPVFGSTYSTPVYSFNDQDFNFRYLEFQNLLYSPTQYESNLISVLSFHIYIMLGLDADSFEPNGGEDYFKQAQAILNYSQQENFKGWKLEDGLQSRFVLIDNLLSPTFQEYRDVIYDYHRDGLDTMNENVKAGKSNIVRALGKFSVLHSRRPNSFLLRTFFDAKADEIEQIFSGGPSVNISSLVSTLEKVAPLHSSKWRNIKF